jgi:rhamnosyltransferase
MSARISIALLTRNGEATLAPLLDAIWKQRTTMPVEVVAIDSGSTDGTRRLLEGRVTKLVTIPATEFNHGLTRNLAVEHTTGDFVVFIVQDGLPTSEKWLAALTAPLLADPQVAGSFARQLPRADASETTKLLLENWVAASSIGWTAAIDAAAWHALSPHERFLRCVFDNVCSCIRRSVWEAHRFAKTPIGEDVEWARDVLLAGHRLVYAPEAVVVHSHERSAAYEYRRTYLVHHRLWDLFELRTIPTAPLAARAVASSLAQHLWRERAHVSRWPRAAALAVAWPAGQYLGARRAVNRRPPPAWRPGTV